MKTKLIFISLATTLFLFTGCTISNSNVNQKIATHLSDERGMTLYTFDKDTKDNSNCYDQCEATWPVFYGNLDTLNLPKNISKEDFRTITRKNGTMQITYKSKPLYYFFKDTQTGDLKGDGIKDIWHIVK
jgi:predicted lipoprotein with Yx(FWY)xxD motif